MLELKMALYISAIMYLLAAFTVNNITLVAFTAEGATAFQNGQMGTYFYIFLRLKDFTEMSRPRSTY